MDSFARLFFGSLLLAILMTGCLDQQAQLENRVVEGIGASAPGAGVVLGNGSASKVIVNLASDFAGESGKKQYMLDVVNEFNVRNPDIFVNITFEYSTGDDGFNTSWRRAIAQGFKDDQYPYDIFYANVGNPYNIFNDLLGEKEWGKKYLVDFSEVPWFIESHKEFILTDPTYTEPFDGMHVGPYTNGFYIMLWYNKRVADRLNLTIREDGMSFQEFLSYVKAVQDYNEMHGTSIAAIQDFNNWKTTEYIYRHLFKSALGNYNLLLDNKEFDVRRQVALLETLQAYEELGKYKPLIKGYQDMSYTEDKGRILYEEALFTANGAWMYTHWAGIDEEKVWDMRPAELPVFRAIDFYSGSYTPVFVVPKGSPRREEALMFLEFLSSPRLAEKWVRMTKTPTGLKGNLYDVGLDDDQFSMFYNHLNEKYSKFHYDDSSASILGAKHADFDDELDDLAQKVLAGELTAQQAYDDIMDYID
ncbi:carbohydrate ABC transporter substrate-binding protein [Candidatus Woesearchaeota archaeon]|nr:carbohydrate ABC transporter substrate-binding protein [Candidatus Woesearchaeota archaeon]